MEEKEIEESLISKYKKNILKKPFVKDRTFLALFLVGLILNLIFLVFIFLGIKTEGTIIQTRFNGFYGVIKTGGWQDFYSMYLIGLLTFAVNSALAVYSFEKERILSFFLLSFSLILQIMLIFQIANFIKLINL